MGALTASDVERHEERAPPLVLLAEDDDAFRGLLAGGLRREGYLVLEAASGVRLSAMVESLLHSGRSPRPELIVTEVRMPGQTGLGVLEQLRRHDWMTPVILMTGFGGAAFESEALRLGATAIFSKPFALEDLRRAARELVPVEHPGRS
jgi:CheY-like chemotaxis protein